MDESGGSEPQQERIPWFRQRRFLFLWFPALGVFGVAALVYLTLAFGPTGWEDVEKEMPRVSREVRAILAGEPVPADEPAGAPAEAEPTSPGFEGELSRLTGLCQKKLGGFGLLDYDAWFWRIVCSPGDRMSLPEEMFRLDPETGVLEPGPGAVAAMRAAARSAMHAAPVRPPPVPEDAEAFRTGLHEALDAMDAFLLRESWATGNLQGWTFWEGNYQQVFHRLSFLSVVRAHLRGEKAKAQGLLEGYLRGLRIFHLGQSCPQGLPSGRLWSALSGGEAVLWGLGSLGYWPAEGVASDGAFVETFVVSPEQARALRTAYADRFRLQTLHSLYSRRMRRGGAWWEVLRTKRKAIVRALIRPVIARELERYVAAAAAGDRAGLLLREDRLLLYFGNTRSFLQAGGVMGHPAFDSMETHFLRRQCAALRFRRDRGAWPHGLHDLTPEYLATSLETDGPRWGMVSLDEMGCTWGPLHDTERMVTREAWERERQAPMMHGKARRAGAGHVSPTDSGEVSACPFMRGEGLPVFYRIAVPPPIAWVDEEKEIVARLEAANEKTVRVVSVSLRVPLAPARVEEMLEWLAETAGRPE